MPAEITVCIQFEGCEPVYRHMKIDEYTARHAGVALDTGDQRLAKIPAGSREHERIMDSRKHIEAMAARCARDVLAWNDTQDGYLKREAPDA